MFYLNPLNSFWSRNWHTDFNKTNWCQGRKFISKDINISHRNKGCLSPSATYYIFSAFWEKSNPEFSIKENAPVAQNIEWEMYVHLHQLGISLLRKSWFRWSLRCNLCQHLGWEERGKRMKLDRLAFKARLVKFKGCNCKLKRKWFYQVFFMNTCYEIQYL